LSTNTILATTPLVSTNYLLRATGTTIGNSLIWDNGTNVGIGNTNTSYTLDVSGTIRATTSAYFGTTSGNIGLGTTTIDTSGGLYTCVTVDSATYSRYSLQSSGVAKGRFQFDATNVSLGSQATGGKLQLFTSAAYNMEFLTNDTLRMTITSAGNVGIGTSSPGERLSVLQSTEAWSASFSNSNGVESVDVYLSYGSGHGMAIDSSENDTKYIFKAAGGTGSGGGKGSVPVILAQCNGNIGMGTVTPSYRLQLSTDSAAKPSTNTWTISSDIRVKENINPYIKGLETILKINPVTYDYNGKAGFDKIKDNIGIIAQDVLDILPESISTYMVKLNDNDDEESELYNFNSHALSYILINAIKEQQSQIEELQEQINILAK
jgi:hypothetical protein